MPHTTLHGVCTILCVCMHVHAFMYANVCVQLSDCVCHSPLSLLSPLRGVPYCALQTNHATDPTAWVK